MSVRGRQLRYRAWLAEQRGQCARLRCEEVSDEEVCRAIRSVPTHYATLLSDTFTDTNGTALASHTMTVGSGWTADSGSYQVQSNQAAAQTTGGVHNIASADAGQADATATLNVVVPGSNFFSAGLSCRVTNGTNLWEVRLQSDSAGANTRVNITEHNAGTQTERVSTTIAFSGTVALQVVLSGSTITAYINGVLQATYASASFNQTATRFGIYNYRDSNGANSYVQVPMDDFLVTGTSSGVHPWWTYAGPMMGSLGMGGPSNL